MMLKENLKYILFRAGFAYVLLATVLFMIGDYKKACVNRLNTITQWGDYPMLLSKEGALADEKKLRMAIRYYKIVTEVFPWNDQPYSIIGYSYFMLHENNLAKKYFEKSKNVNPNHFWNDYNLGQIYYRLGDYESAKKAFRNIVGCDINEAMKQVIIAPLISLSLEERHQFRDEAFGFVKDIRETSFKLLFKISFEQQRYKEAETVALIALRSSNEQDRSIFLLYWAAAAYADKKFEDSVRIARLLCDQYSDKSWGRFILISSLNASRHEGLQDSDKFRKLFLNDQKLFPDNLMNVVIHPWNYRIQPGKELLL